MTSVFDEGVAVAMGSVGVAVRRRRRGVGCWCGSSLDKGGEGGDKALLRRDCHLIEFSEGAENKTVYKFNKNNFLSFVNINILSLYKEI